MSSVVGIDNQGKHLKFDLNEAMSRIGGESFCQQRLVDETINRAFLISRTLSNFIILKCTISYLNAVDSVFEGGQCVDVNFQNSDFNCCQFIGVIFRNVTFSESTLRNTVFERCFFEKCQFQPLRPLNEDDNVLFKGSIFIEFDPANIHRVRFQDSVFYGGNTTETLHHNLRGQGIPLPGEEKAKPVATVKRDTPTQPSEAVAKDEKRDGAGVTAPPKASSRFDKLELKE